MPPVQQMVHLRSKDALLLHPLTVGFSVGANGDIAEAPRKFMAGPDEIVQWVVGNASGVQVTVSLITFLRRRKHTDETGDPGDPVTPFLWLGSNGVTLQPGETKLIAGRRDPSYPKRDLFDSLSYTIRVEGPFGTIDYDPDGDIKP